MSTRRLGTATAVLASVLLSRCSVEQVQLGQWYRLDTPAQGACPALVWQFVFAADRSIGGFVSSHWTRTATLSGALAADDTFRMTTGTTTVAGAITSRETTMAIHGTGLGAGCDGTTFRLVTGRYYQSLSGGGGGGNS